MNGRFYKNLEKCTKIVPESISFFCDLQEYNLLEGKGMLFFADAIQQD